MGKEESPQIERRSTRHSSATISKNEAGTKSNEPLPPTVNDLFYGEEEKPISLDDVVSSFPGRRIQIIELMRVLGPVNCPMVPLFIYGDSSTGKTSITLQIFRHLNRPFVYSSCLTCYSPRILFESILNQLLLHRKSMANSYLSAKRCERPSDFVNFLREALISITSNLQGNSGKSGSKKLDRRASGNMIYLIFDNLERVREWDKSSIMLPFLLNLYDILKMPEVGLIFISNTSPDTYYSSMGYAEPTPVYFPDYKEDDLRQIFVKNQENKKLYSSFLDVVLKPFYRITRRVDELSTAFSQLYKKYCEPLSDLGVVPNEEMKRRLFSNLQPHIAPSMNEIFKVSSQPSTDIGATKEAKQKSSSKKSGLEVTDQLDLHMSTSAKYLLISAFLASRNPATLDASLFDSTGGSDSRKRKRKPSEKTSEQKEAAEQELLMKGPGTFPLERLLAIFQCITSVAEGSLEEEEQGSDGLRVQVGDNSLMSDVLLQLSSLCNANFIVKGVSCPLEGSTRYRSTICEDMALKVARSLKFPLSKYLYRR
ncbi:Origin recognition complex, subunit [Parasponia andersonii]|uniref:Origin recognition complex, subunit n=1 Tax=Parasponia andersonii TaxID=3476 RepID=A0A2P5D4B9_PARAD|nr:Origin recognition complex, subunit [Parasponia andersonii]